MRDTNKNNTREMPFRGEFARNELTDANWNREIINCTARLLRILLK